MGRALGRRILCRCRTGSKAEVGAEEEAVAATKAAAGARMAEEAVVGVVAAGEDCKSHRILRRLRIWTL